ncbi:hypothetical protein C0993_001187 [Termitomyces sp. T159_Od127]|nr:hypothetical protein C0993_001187 [Termitomyces sp. T159_Od127]
MSPASRYQHNLKVLRRRDPTITSIFDQFSHVCVYHHNGTKWEKLGYEGSMFLYERESYPPYGFYILNRMGKADHIQRLYPEDNIGAHGSYLIIRSYPEFTDRRLANVRAAFNGATLDKFHDAYAVPHIETLPANQKGESKTIGLWMFATDSREPLIDTFTRLHSYIKRNQPYPQEFRYGPDRPPPSTSLTNQPQANGVSSLTATPSRASFPGHAQGQPSQGGLSELDRLFAKMQPTPLLSAAIPAQPRTSDASVPSILTATSDNQSVTIPSPPSSSSTGLSLLNSIFASASVPATIGPSSSITSVSTSTSSSSTSTLTIHNPIPTTTPAPQVLDQSTLKTLLGFPPSRSASAASTAYSTDARSSHSSSREGDNEDGDTSDSFGHGQGSPSDGYSTSSTVLDPDADEEVQAAGASAGRPVVAEPVNGRGYANGRSGHGHGHGQGRRINGDVTPRPPMNGFMTPPVVRQHCPAALGPASVVGRRQHHRSQQGDHPSVPASHDRVPPGTERPLVPFESDSDLWPYANARATTTTTMNNDNNNRTATTNKNNASTYHNEQRSPNGGGGDDDDEIIELDFEDTSALSDPGAFRPHRSNANGVRAAQEKKGRAKKRQSRKERAAEQAREREDIERSWDVPAAVPTLRAGGRVYEYCAHPESPSPSPCVSPDPLHPLQQKLQGMPNGNGRNGVAAASSSSKQGANVYPPLERGQVVVPEAVRDSVVAATEMAGKVKKTQVLERNDFVREVLTLIHTDKAFVDSLYKEYTSRVG